MTSHAYDPNLPCVSSVSIRGSKQARGGRGRMVRNKARRPARYPTIPRFPVYYYSTILVRCLLRQTNPISGRPERRLTAAGERSYDEWDLERASENKANFRRAITWRWHGQDARGTHGRDGRATGTPNAINRVWEGVPNAEFRVGEPQPTHGRSRSCYELRQTNPISGRAKGGITADEERSYDE
jgi:hypothetical protein